jgi:uncharacterized protein YndB with AHSA1/START domain
MINKTVISKDPANRKLHVVREFNAPVEKVWKAWTESNLLDKWWAPKPWKAETKTMDFRAGGLWLYRMAGPNGEGSWCRVDFKAVTPQQSFTTAVSFCDEDGNIDTSFPRMYWLIEFMPAETGTKVEVMITFDKDADMTKIIEMGFEEGFTMGLGNLDELLEA